MSQPHLIRSALQTLALAAALGASPPAAAAQSPPVIRSASEYDYPPFCLVDSSGRADGFSVELLRAALQAMGRDVTYRTGPWSQVRGWLENGEVDALPLVGRTPERETLFDFTFPYMSLHGAIVVPDTVTGIRGLEDLASRRVAVMAGDNAEEFLRREPRDFTIVTTATYEDALSDLAGGRCDAVVMQRLVALRLIRLEHIDGLRVLSRPVEGFRQDWCFAVRQGDRDLLALLNEGLSVVMADGTFRRLRAKWYGAHHIPSGRRLLVGARDSYPPYVFRDGKAGRPAGFSIDLLRAMARHLGLDLDIRLGPWDRIRRDLERGELDIVPGMLYSLERERRHDFSQPHAISYYVAVVRRDSLEPPATMEDLAGLRLVVERGDIMHDLMQARPPGGPVAVVSTQEEALRQVAAGEHDGALVARQTAHYWIRQRGWENLVVGEQALHSAEACFAVPQGQRALVSLLDDGLKDLEETGEYRRLQRKWLAVDSLAGPGLVSIVKWVAAAAGPLALLLLASVLWSRSLRRQVAERTGRLQESEAHYRLLAETSPVGITEVDLHGRIVYANSAAEQILGLQRSEIVGRAYDAPQWRIEADDGSALPREELPFARVAASTQPVRDVRHAIRRPDGRRVLLRVHGAPRLDETGGLQSAIFALEDITSEAARARRTEALNHIREAVWQMRGPADFEDLLQAVARELEALGVPFRNLGLNLLDDTDSPRAFTAYTRHAQGRFADDVYDLPPNHPILRIWTAGRPAIRPDIDRSDPYAERAALRGRDSEVRALVDIPFDRGTLAVSADEPGLYTDSHVESLQLVADVVAEGVRRFDDLRALEQHNQDLTQEVAERQRLEQDLVRLERQRAATDLAAGVSHNLNNILTAVLGPAHLIARHTDDPRVQREAATIRQAAERARDLVQRLSRAVQPADERTVEAVDLNEQVRAAAELARPRWQDETRARGVDVQLQLNLSGIPTIGASPTDLSDALLNLLYNAIEAMPEGGTVTIATEPDRVGARLTVADTGVGMDADTRRRVFEPFFTTRRDVGSGLGLSTVRAMVERLGGTIDVDSAPGQGATFTLWFPPYSSEATAQPEASRPARILVVEDEVEAAGFLCRFLEETHHLEVCASAEEALRRTRPGQFDVALIDLGLPGTPGDEVARQLRRRDPSLSTVLVTGWELAVDDPRRVPFDFHLAKPFADLDELENTIARAIALRDERS